jgi:hypothetical protein
MDILDSILEKWAKEKNVEILINADLFSDQAAIQSSLDKISEPERSVVLAQLDEIETALSQYIDGIEQEKITVKKQIDGTFKSEKACLSYGSSANIQNKGQPTKEE